jgi:hypothetical protein
MNTVKLLFVKACIALMFVFNTANGNAMEADQALKLVEAFGKSVRDNAYIGRMQVDARGGFITRSRGAIFRYDSLTRKLLVSYFISQGLTSMGKNPDRWDKLIRHGKRMPRVMGEGQFELIRQGPFLDYDDFPVLLLTKEFHDAVGIKPEQFVIETQWLLSGGVFWSGAPSPYGLTGVMTQSEDALVNIADEVEKTYKPRPW